MSKIVLCSNYLGNRSLDVYIKFYSLLTRYNLFPDIVSLSEPFINKAGTLEQEANTLLRLQMSDETIYIKKKKDLRYLGYISFLNPKFYRLGKYSLVHNSIVMEFTIKDKELIGKEEFFISLSKQIHEIFSSDITYMSPYYSPCSDYLQSQPVEAMCIHYLTILGKVYVDFFGGVKKFQHIEDCKIEQFDESLVLYLGEYFSDLQKDFYKQKIINTRNFLDPDKKKIINQFEECELGFEYSLEQPFY